MNQIPLSSMIMNRSRSMGIKLLVVSVLALIMGIPALFVDNIVQDRTSRAQDVIREVSDHAGGPQTFLGPTLVIPYTTAPLYKGDTPLHGIYVVFPNNGDANVIIHTTERRRSLFKVPVFDANLEFDASFNPSGSPSALPPGAVLDSDHATIVVGVSDPRGALSDGTLSANGKTISLVPLGNILDPNSQQPLPLTYFGTPLSTFVTPNAAFHLNANLHFSGAQQLSILAFGKTTHVTMEGDWPNPGFNGGFLPVKRTISSKGFTAEWMVPYMARGIRSEGPNYIVSALNSISLGTSFVEVADPYQSVSRSLKYVLLFVGLLFLTYFVFEVTTSQRVHPAQYVLVGIAQLIFYLLLVSFAEHMGFDWGFLIAGSSTVLLLTANILWIFKSRAQAVRGFLVFGLLYFFIYLMLRLEDNALLVGAVASFLAVAAVMYFTRNINWYSSLAPREGSANEVGK